MQNEGKIRTKVIVGYSLLGLFAIVSVWYIFRLIYRSTDATQDANAIQQKSLKVSKVLSSLYELEYSANRLYQIPSQVSFTSYNSAMRTLDTNISILKSDISSQKQNLLINEIQNLLQKKKQNIQVLFTLYKSSSPILIKEMVDKIMSTSPAPYTRDLIILTNVNENTVYKEVIKPNLWQKMFGKKSLKEEDVRIDTISVFTSDTIKTSFTTQNSIPKVLKKVHDQVQLEQISRKQKIEYQLERIISTDQKILVQISLLISELSNEVMDNSLKDLAKRENVFHKSFRYISIVAFVAILLAFFFIFAIFKDINRSRAYKRELELAKIRAEELMRSRQQLLLTISHDIKAPLCSITGYLDLLEVSVDTKAKQYASSMKISTSYISNLLGNLLAFAHLESGKANLNIQLFDLHVFFRDIYESLIPLAQEKNIVFVVQDTSEDIQSTENNSPKNYTIETDMIRLQQVIMNLLSNALKFTQKGKVYLSYCISPNNILKIIVKDTGCGIPEEKKEIIFEKFSRLEAINNPLQEGNGLGLSVVKGIIHLLGGSIYLSSKIDQGSTFTVEIPIHICETTPQIISSLKGFSILFIDDDPLQLRMVKEMLATTHHTVYTAKNKEEAQEIWSSIYLDKIFTDLQMPEFSGYELLQMLRQSNDKIIKNLPVYALSASDHTHQAELKSQGFEDFLKKPFTLNQILTFLNSTTLVPGPNRSAETIPLVPGPNRSAETISLVPGTNRSAETIPLVPGTNRTKSYHLGQALIAPSIESSIEPSITPPTTPLSTTSTTCFHQLLDLMSGDEAAVWEVLGVFCEDTGRNIRNLEESLGNKNYGEIKRICHRMLPMFLQLGIGEVSERLSAIDQCELKNMDETKEIEIKQIIKLCENFLREV